jgi:hypothetical protein
MAALSRFLLGLPLGLALVVTPGSSFVEAASKKGKARALVVAESKPAQANKRAKPVRRAKASAGPVRARPGKRKATESASPSARPPRSSIAPLAPLPRVIACPSDMVAVAGRVCVDRFEMSIVDAASGDAWSPFYTPDPVRARSVFDFYTSPEAPPTLLENAPPIPEPPRLVLQPVARSQSGVLPQGYLSAVQAEAACTAAGKRLCSEAEWLTACRGEAQRDFPYGDKYERGTCNVYRESHPSALLHNDASRFHDDPRNHLVEIAGRTFLQPTNANSSCASRWGDDAVIDMVGNLDEWVADSDGVFLGGFYSRGSRAGCQARVSSHVRAYSDYSTGARCCKDPD